jgi:copper chaperone NosL
MTVPVATNLTTHETETHEVTQASSSAEDVADAPGGLRRSVGFGWTRIRGWTSAHGDRVFPPIAAVLLIVSIALPWWQLTLHAPQYIEGLSITIFVDHVGGGNNGQHVDEINGLNHYIGMRSLDEGGELERSLSIYAIPLMAGLGALVALRRRWLWLLALPAITLPVIFTADLYYWLYSFGHELDPKAALSNAIHEFTPTLLGNGRVAQFTTTSVFGSGFYLAVLASLLLISAVVIQIRRDGWAGARR